MTLFKGCVQIDERQSGPPRHRAQELSLFSVSVAPLCTARPAEASRGLLLRGQAAAGGPLKKLLGLFTRQTSKESNQD